MYRTVVKLANQDTRDKGLAHVFSMLSEKGWKYEVEKRGRAELCRIRKNDAEHVIKIRTLSKEDPVPFPDGLDQLDGVDYLVVCNNLQGQPNMVVLKPETVREIIHKDPVNEKAYWLEKDDYNRDGMSFEQIFG